MNQKNKRKALLLGYYGARNLGDDMMLVCLQGWLAQYDYEVSVISENPVSTSKRFHLPCVKNSPLLGQWSWYNSWFRGYALALIRAIKNHNMLVVGGGDLIRDDKGWKTFWYTTEKIFLALLFQRKVCLLNVGIGKPKSRVSTYALKYALRKAEKIIVRDRRSLAVCKDLNAGDKAVLAHDIVLDIHAFHEVKFRNPQKTVTGEESREYCVFCLRHNPDTYSGFQLDERKLACISDMLDIVIQYHNVRVMCVPFQGGKNNDNDLHGKVLKNMQHQEHAEILDWNGNISEILSYFKNAKFVIAMRLHAVVLAVLYDKPCIVFPYDIKVNEFCAQFNIKSIIQSDDLLNSTKVQQMLTEVMNAPSVSYDKSSSWCSIGLDV